MPRNIRIALRTAAASALAVGFIGTGLAFAQTSATSLGIFESQSDVGSVVPPGTATFDAATGVYTLRSAGANLWVNVDAFHFVWKKVSGDVSLTADVKLTEAGPTASPHRKALLMFRQTLDPDSLYADAAIHGNGETALQYRRNKGDTTQDIAFNIGAPERLRLEKRGDTITLFLSAHGEPLHQVGASIKLHFDGDFYAGLGVCAHNPDAIEQATFAHVDLQPLMASATPAPTVLYSTLQTIAIDNNARMDFVIQTGMGQMEAPNWSRDGKTLIFDRAGKLWTVPAAEGDGSIAEATQLDIGDASDCTGSHGLSPDGKWLAMTCTTPDHPGRRVYIVPATGGAPRMVTDNPDSYFHSWSPDGKTILFTRPSQRHAEHLCHFARRRSGDRADHGHRRERRPGFFGRWQVDLFQFRPRWRNANLAHASRRQPARAGDLRREAQLDAASLARRKIDSDPLLRQGRGRARGQ